MTTGELKLVRCIIVIVICINAAITARLVYRMLLIFTSGVIASAVLLWTTQTPVCSLDAAFWNSSSVYSSPARANVAAAHCSNPETEIRTGLYMVIVVGGAVSIALEAIFVVSIGSALTKLRSDYRHTIMMLNTFENNGDDGVGPPYSHKHASHLGAFIDDNPLGLFGSKSKKSYTNYTFFALSACNVIVFLFAISRTLVQSSASASTFLCNDFDASSGVLYRCFIGPLPTQTVVLGVAFLLGLFTLVCARWKDYMRMANLRTNWDLYVQEFKDCKDGLDVMMDSEYVDANLAKHNKILAKWPSLEHDGPLHIDLEKIRADPQLGEGEYMLFRRLLCNAYVPFKFLNSRYEWFCVTHHPDYVAILFYLACVNSVSSVNVTPLVNMNNSPWAKVLKYLVEFCGKRDHPLEIACDCESEPQAYSPEGDREADQSTPSPTPSQVSIALDFDTYHFLRQRVWLKVMKQGEPDDVVKWDRRLKRVESKFGTINLPKGWYLEFGLQDEQMIENDAHERVVVISVPESPRLNPSPSPSPALSPAPALSINEMLTDAQVSHLLCSLRLDINAEAESDANDGDALETSVLSPNDGTLTEYVTKELQQQRNEMEAGQKKACVVHVNDHFVACRFTLTQVGSHGEMVWEYDIVHSLGSVRYQNVLDRYLRSLKLNTQHGTLKSMKHQDQKNELSNNGCGIYAAFYAFQLVRGVKISSLVPPSKDQLVSFRKIAGDV